MGRFDRRSTAEEVGEGVDLRGRLAIVTGANAGLGRETTRVLARCGARVVLACRDVGKATATRETILRESEGAIDPERLEIRRLDLASLASVRAFASEFVATGRPLHLLVNNAGIMLPDRRETEDGFEAHFGTNHLGPFLLTNLLLDPLRAGAPSRVINLSSEAMRLSGLTAALDDLDWKRRRWSGTRAYGSSKLMNLLFTRALHRRLAGSGVVSNAVHPGIVRTELARSQPWPFLLLGAFFFPWIKSVGAGAATTVYAATAPEWESRGGVYLADCAPARAPRLADDAAVQERLWTISEERTGLARGDRS